jgi:hypothetical protein
MSRLQDAQKDLAGILGIPRKSVANIHAEIGTTVLTQFFRTTLAQKTSLSPQETGFLATIGAKLDMPAQEYEVAINA